MISSLLPELERLSRAIEEIRNRCRSTVLLAIPWMNVKHPIPAAQIRILRAAEGGPRPGRSGRCAAKIAARAAIGLAYALWFCLRLARLRLRCLSLLNKARGGKPDLVIKSWRFGLESPAEGPDFYFGDLKERLQAEGLSVLTVWGDPRGGNWNARPGSREDNLPELSLVPLASPLQLLARQWAAALRLFGMGLRARDRLATEICFQGAEDCVSHRILPVALYEWIGEEICRIWNPKAVVTLYEGHAWEQCFWHGVRSRPSGCATVGYQHTVLFRHSLALLKPALEGGAPIRPDIVLCLGERTRQLLQPSHPVSRLIPFGSFREIPVPRGTAGPAPDRKTILVLPEGHLDETLLLFRHALELAAAAPDHRFILRCHPVLSFERIRGPLGADLSSHPNVELSSGRSLTEDFGRASCILYRGSSSVLYAILGGLKPIYLRDSLLGEIDPLYELQVWRERTSAPGESARILRRFASDGASAGAEWGEAAGYVRGYVRPVDEESVRLLLSGLQLEKGRRP